MQKTNDKTSKERPRIFIVNHGVANRYSDNKGERIEINRALLRYPKLYKAILEHELKHTPGRYKFKDLKLDMWDGIKKPGKWRFILKHPSTWIQFSPVWFTKEKGTVVDIGNLSNSLVFLVLLWIIIKLFLRFI